MGKLPSFGVVERFYLVRSSLIGWTRSWSDKITIARQRVAFNDVQQIYQYGTQSVRLTSDGSFASDLEPVLGSIVVALSDLWHRCSCFFLP